MKEIEAEKKKNNTEKLGRLRFAASESLQTTEKMKSNKRIGTR